MCMEWMIHSGLAGCAFTFACKYSSKRLTLPASLLTGHQLGFSGRFSKSAYLQVGWLKLLSSCMFLTRWISVLRLIQRSRKAHWNVPFLGWVMFPGHEANPQNGKAKTIQVSARGCGCSVEGGTHGSGRQWERRRWVRVCSPRNFQGSHSSFLGGQWVGRCPWSLWSWNASSWNASSWNASPVASQEWGKQALAPTPGSSPAGELPLLSPPPCASDSLKSHQGDSCLPGSTSMLNRTDVSAGSSRSASPKPSECGWKCLFVCDHIRSVHLTPVPFCVPSPRARVACAGCDSRGALASVCQHGALQIWRVFFNYQKTKLWTAVEILYLYTFLISWLP